MLSMPRVVAAVLLGALGFLASEMIKDIMPEGTGFGYFSLVNLMIGMACGWVVVGSRAGRGWIPAINNGITGGVALVAWGLFIQGGNKMVEDSFDRRFKDPMEAFASIFKNILDYAGFMVDADLIITLVVGSIIMGLLTEFSSRHWR